MAGAGAKLFTSGSVLTADQVNTFLMDQSIMRFTSTTTRDAAFGGAGEPTLAEGMFAYTTDTNTLWSYNGSSWVAVLGSDIGEISTDNRNVVINGAMQVSQRSSVGAAVTGITTANYYTADRFILDINTLGTWTQSVEADAPTGSGFRNSLKMLCTTADASPAVNDYLIIQQRLEGQNLQQFLKGTASAKPFAFSFWVKSNVTGTYICELNDTDNTRTVSASYTISASATWEKKTITFPADTTGAFTNDNNQSLQLSFWLSAATNFTSGTLATTWASTVNANRAVGQTNLAAATSNYWQVTGIQLEVGSVATPFEFEDINTTLAKCQRYYWRFQTGSLWRNFATGTAVSSTTMYMVVPLPTTLRTNPTAIEWNQLRAYDGLNVYTVTAVATTVAFASTGMAQLDVTGVGLATFRPYFLQTNDGGYLAVFAEL